MLEEFNRDDRRLVAAHDIDQIDQQVRFFGEDAGEDIVVPWIEQIEGGGDLGHARRLQGVESS